MRAWLPIAVVPVAVLAVASACGSFAASSEGAADAAGADGSAEGGAGSSVPCSARPLTSWQAPRRMTELAGESGERGFAHPFVTADGLTLWVDRKAGGKHEVFRATRPTRAASFGTLQRIAALDNPDYLPPYPSSAADDEVVVAVPGSAADVAARARAGDGTCVYVRIDQRPDNELAPTISADGRLVLYLHFAAEGPARFFTVVTSDRARAAPGEEWSQMKSAVEEYPDGGEALPNGEPISDPALAPDGRGLFYQQRGRVHYVDRPTLSSPFFSAGSTPVALTALDVETEGGVFYTAVRSITADGCEVYLTSNRDGEDDVYVSQRGP